MGNYYSCFGKVSLLAWLVRLAVPVMVGYMRYQNFPQITFSILEFLSISQDDNPQLNSKLKMMRDVEYCDIYDVYVISVFRFLPAGIV